MKLTAILLLVGSLTVSARGKAQDRVTLHLKGASLETVLDKIQEQTGYTYLYSAKDIPLVKKFDVNVSGATVEQVLDQCFKGLPVRYEISNKMIRILKIVGAPAIVNANTLEGPGAELIISVTGDDGNPLAGASVKIQGARVEGVTNEAGILNAKDISYGKYRIEITYVGFQAYVGEIDVKRSRVSSNFTLKRASSNLDQIAVVAYGQTTQRLSTGDVTMVTSRQISDQPVNNPLAALEGRVPGLLVTQNTGAPGGSFTVQIRGQNSITNGNDPFYVIDGVPYSSEMLPGLGNSILQVPAVNGAPGAGSPLSFINPADIESISVLKDADATAIYGSRGANGAILITTKKGHVGNTRVDVNAYSGIGMAPRSLKWLNTNQYLEMRHEAFANDGATPNVGTAPDLLTWDTTRYTNWQKALIGGTAHYDDVQLSVSGGNVTTQYLVGGGFHRETTVFPTSNNDKKGSVHFNLTSSSVDQRFKFVLTGNYMADDNNLPYVDVTSYIKTAPDGPTGFNSDGTLNWANSSWTNPYAATQQTYQGQTNNLISNATLSYNILKGLDLKSSFGYTNMQVSETYLYPIASQNPAYSPTGSSGFATNSIHSWIIEPQVTYQKQLGRGKLEALAGMTFQQNVSRGLVQYASGYTSDALLQDIQAAPNLSTNSVIDATYKYNAGFGRLKYNYDDRYLADINFRRDGSSRFGPANQFHDFASVGLGWIFSKTKLVQNNLRVLSFGKLHGSYGTTGNDQIGDYHFYNLFNTTRYPYQGTSGLTPTSLFNPGLAWELTKKWEGGLDLGFVKDRVLISGDYYLDRSSNELLSYSLPAITGFTSVPANFPATVQNTGWEFSVNSTNIKSRSFTWTTTLNLTVPRNKLVAFPNLATSSYKYNLAIGQPVAILHAFHSLGVNDTTGVYEFQSSKGSPTYSPVYNTDNTKIINLAPRYFGGMENELTYKSIRLGFMVQFTKRTGINPLFLAFYPPGGLYAGNVPKGALNRWQAPGQHAQYEKFTQLYGSKAFTAYQYAKSSDGAYTDASFIRIKNVSLSYDLPRRWLGKFRRCSIYMHAENLLTFTKYKGLDPEVQSLSVLPPLRVFTGGIQLGL